MARSLSKPEAFIPGPPEKAKRDRSWERAQQAKTGMSAVTFRRIPTALRDEINEIAQGLFVNRDEVARAIMEAGLEVYRSGDLPMETTLIRGRFYLFEENAENEG